MTLSLGIDVGTSGVRTAVMDGDRLVAMARAEHPKQDTNNIDANGWWDAVDQCLQAQAAELRRLDVDPKSVERIAVDGTSGSMVLTNADLNPVCASLMYNSKGFNAEAAIIADHAPSDHITRGSNSALARAMRLLSRVSGAPAHLLHQADFIAAKLSGRGGYSDFNNALKTGYDPETESWPEWIGEVFPVELLPDVRPPGSEIGAISEACASRYGFSQDTKIHAGTTDSIAAFLASAPLQEGVAVTSLGSTLAVKLLSKTRIDDASSGLYSHRLGAFWLVGGASNTGGAVLKAHFDDQALQRLTKSIIPDRPLGLNFYPLLKSGERFPINDPALPPVMEPRPADDALFLQAMLEGMADIEARCYEAITAKGGPRPERILTAGGGAKNEEWTEIRARALGQMPQLPRFGEAAIGAAKLAVMDVSD